MDTSLLFSGFDSSLATRRVFGDPIERDGVIVIPAAKVGGGGGGGEGTGGRGERAQGQGSGLGFGLSARPVGAFVLDRGKLRWKPAVDVNRVVLGAQLVGIAAFWALGSFFRLRARVLDQPRRRRLGLLRRRQA